MRKGPICPTPWAERKILTVLPRIYPEEAGAELNHVQAWEEPRTDVAPQAHLTAVQTEVRTTTRGLAHGTEQVGDPGRAGHRLCLSPSMAVKLAALGSR